MVSNDDNELNNELSKIENDSDINMPHNANSIEDNNVNNSKKDKGVRVIKREAKDIISTTIADIVSVGATFGISALMYAGMAIFPEFIAPAAELVRNGVAPYWGGKIGELTANVMKKILRVNKQDKQKIDNNKTKESFTKRVLKKIIEPFKGITKEGTLNLVTGSLGAIAFFALATALTTPASPMVALIITSVSAMTGGYLGEKYLISGIKKAYKEKLGIPKAARNIKKLFSKKNSKREILEDIDKDIIKQKEEVTKVMKELIEQDRGAEIVEVGIRGLLRIGRIGAILTGTSIGGFANLADDIIIPMAVNSVLLTTEKTVKLVNWAYNKTKNNQKENDLENDTKTVIMPDEDETPQFDENRQRKLQKTDSEITLVDLNMDESDKKSQIQGKDTLEINKNTAEKIRKANKLNKDIAKIDEKNKEYENNNSNKISNNTNDISKSVVDRNNSNNGFNDV